jgi:DNA polymerase sigma
MHVYDSDKSDSFNKLFLKFIQYYSILFVYYIMKSNACK